jgi:hypothetical protein
VLVALLASVALLPSAGAAPHRASKARCPKGKKLVVVKKKGKVVKKKCVKKTPKPSCRAGASGCAIPGPAPAPAPAPSGLFEAPGRNLEGEAAKPFMERYLASSTFTSCPAGWPNCGGFEDRYSHGPGSNFHKCILRPSAGSDIVVNDEYRLEGAEVAPDGSWTIVEMVYDFGHEPHYKWHVSSTGVVEGEYAFPGEPVEHIGPLQYVSGAKDCSY